MQRRTRKFPKSRIVMGMISFEPIFGINSQDALWLDLVRKIVKQFSRQHMIYHNLLWW